MTAPLAPGHTRRANIPLYIDRRADDDTAMRARFAPFGDDANLAPADEREPKLCPRCGEVCKHDGWGHVHSTGTGIRSCTPAAVADNAGEDDVHPASLLAWVQVVDGSRVRCAHCGEPTPCSAKVRLHNASPEHRVYCAPVASCYLTCKQLDDPRPAASPRVQADDGRTEELRRRVLDACDRLESDDDEPGFDAGPDYWAGLAAAARRIRAALDAET